MERSQGFTVIEIIIAVIVVGVATTVLFIQRGNLEAAQRDKERKVAINAMYYNLEEVFYEKNNYYPNKIDSKLLRAMDPMLFTDPLGIKLGDPDSDYRYTPIGCDNVRCKGYELRTNLEKEADYVKNHRNQ